MDPSKGEKERKETEEMVRFVPYYVVGNLCIASTSLPYFPIIFCWVEMRRKRIVLIRGKIIAWMIFWNSSQLKTANIFVLINSFTQLYFIFTKLPPMNTSSTSSILTHIVSKTFAGIGVLDFLHNGSVAYFDHQGPNTLVKMLTGVGAVALGSVSDWIFGGCLVYDLVALSVGQSAIRGSEGWSKLLAGYAVGTAAVVGLRNWFR